MSNDDIDDSDLMKKSGGYPLQWNEGIRPDDLGEASKSSEDE